MTSQRGGMAGAARANRTARNRTVPAGRSEHQGHRAPPQSALRPTSLLSLQSPSHTHSPLMGRMRRWDWTAPATSGELALFSVSLHLLRAVRRHLVDTGPTDEAPQ